MSLGNVHPLTPFPALLIKERRERYLVVADLHIGWEMNLTQRGIYIPSQTSRLQTRLTEVIAKAKPTKLVILGDVKQAVPKITMEEWKAVPEFLEGLEKVVKDIVIVPGNHDGDLEPLTPRSVKLTTSEGFVLGERTRVAVFHGHAWPPAEAFSADLLVMSHIHPVVWFKDKLGLWMVKQVWVKAVSSGDKLIRAYLKYINMRQGKDPSAAFRERLGVVPGSPRLIVIPAFNDLVGGFSVDRLAKEASGPVIGSGGIDLVNAELYLLDGTFLGTVKQFSQWRQEG